jgi:hypothetical protein
LAQNYVSSGNRAKAEEHTKRLEALLEPAEYEEMMRRLNVN